MPTDFHAREKMRISANNRRNAGYRALEQNTRTSRSVPGASPPTPKRSAQVTVRIVERLYTYDGCYWLDATTFTRVPTSLIPRLLLALKGSAGG